MIFHYMLYTIYTIYTIYTVEGNFKSFAYCCSVLCSSVALNAMNALHGERPFSFLSLSLIPQQAGLPGRSGLSAPPPVGLDPD